MSSARSAPAPRTPAWPRPGPAPRPQPLAGGQALVPGARRGGRKASANGVNTTEVREWAKAQGIEVKDRGRVPAELVVKFKAATAG